MKKFSTERQIPPCSHSFVENNGSALHESAVDLWPPETGKDRGEEVWKEAAERAQNRREELVFSSYDSAGTIS